VNILLDAKSGYVDATTDYQLGAYAHGRRYDTHHPLPPIDKGLILRVNDEGCQSVWISRERLDQAYQLFCSLRRVWQDLVEHKLAQSSDVYRLTIDGVEHHLPRVTAILKTVLSKGKLVDWQIKQALTYTLQEMLRHQRTPQQTLDAYQGGFFDPTTGSRDYMLKRGKQGTAMHECLQRYLLQLPVVIDPTDTWLTKAFGHLKTWADAHQMRVVDGLTETKIYNLNEGYAGTLDAVVTVEP
jgi:hypothetical protein